MLRPAADFLQFPPERTLWGEFPAVESQPEEQVVVVGAGFGGLEVARTLAREAPHATVTVVDRSNHHLFQPLLYQVATAGLSPEDIAYPIRGVFRSASNVAVLYREVIGVDPVRRQVLFSHGDPLPYSILVLATGATHHYFGHPEWERHAPGLKSIEDAMEIRKRVLLAFEEAEAEGDAERRNALLQFAVIGGGPTGVELAGALAELAHTALAADFHRINPRSARIVLIEAGERLLPAFPADLGEAARRALEDQGVEVLLGTMVRDIDETSLDLGDRRVSCITKIWAAGIRPSPAANWLSAASDRAGRVVVEPNLTVPGHPEIFVIGDTALVIDPRSGTPLPGVAAVAMQEGKYVGKIVRARLRDGIMERSPQAEPPFRFADRGNLATVGKSFAVADIGGRRLSGRVAWWLWLFVHIIYLMGFRNRLSVLIQWAYAYVTFHRGARLIVEPADGVVASTARARERVSA